MLILLWRHSWLDAHQELSLRIALPALAAHRSLPGLSALGSAEGLEVPWCTSHTVINRNCTHRPFKEKKQWMWPTRKKLKELIIKERCLKMQSWHLNRLLRHPGSLSRNKLWSSSVAVILIEPAGKASFVLRLHGNETNGQWNGEWLITLVYASKPLQTLITAVLMLIIFAVLLCYLSNSQKKPWKIHDPTGLEPWPLQCWCSWAITATGSWGPDLESPETFRAYFGWHNSLCIFKTKASRGTKLCSYFHFYPLYNIWKDQLCRISKS